MTAPGSASDNIRWYGNSLTIPYTIIMAFSATARGTGGNNDYLGMGLRESGTGKIITFNYQSNGNLGAWRYTNPTTYSGNSEFTAEGYRGVGPMIWLKLVNNSTNRLYSISTDGQAWVQVASIATGTFLTEDQAGILLDSSSGTGFPLAMTVYHWVVGP
jgi:hypothetical protein